MHGRPKARVGIIIWVNANWCVTKLLVIITNPSLAKVRTNHK